LIKPAVVQKQDTFSSEDVDRYLGEVEQPYPFIPPGEYDVVFVKAHAMNMYKGRRLITYWRIQDLASEHLGKILIMGFQYPIKGKKWGPLSKMAQCYRLAAGRDPARLDTGRLSTTVFNKKLFGARVVTVTKGNDPKGRKQDERAPENHYSVIDTLVELKVG